MVGCFRLVLVLETVVFFFDLGNTPSLTVVSFLATGLQGYELIDEVVWVKQTVNRRLAKSHGYYLQHAKETCLVAKIGNDPKNFTPGGSDIIWSERRGQSQKPEEIYELIQNLVPNGYYLEIFGRRNNLHDYWVTVGNEL